MKMLRANRGGGGWVDLGWVAWKQVQMSELQSPERCPKNAELCFVEISGLGFRGLGFRV